MFRPFMNFIAVDADPVARDALCQCLAQAAPGCHYAAAGCAADTLAFAADCPPDAVFLDPKLPDMDGIQLADMLLKQYPGLHIIFVTAYAEYAIPAFALHAAGYVLKPADPARLKQELTFLYRKRVKIQTFGGFEVFVDGKLLTFHRAKAKELLACLVDRHGAGLTTREACSLLWEDGVYHTARKNYFQTIVRSLRTTLEQAGVAEILVKAHNQIAVRPELLDCDSYRLLDGDPQAVKNYRQNYLPGYSWAEFSAGHLEHIYFSAE